MPQSLDVAVMDNHDIRDEATAKKYLNVATEAELRGDRWAAIEPIGLKGSILTKPIYWSRPRLSINADARDGAILAELVDPWGKPVEGYTVKESDPFTGDALDHIMTWKGKVEIHQDLISAAYWEGYPGRMMSIRFYLESARLFSFTC